MTDEQIIKALKCCEGDDGISYCNKCSLYEYDNCVHHISQKAREVINRQKAEIDILIRKKETLRDEIAELQAENERLKEKYDRTMDNLKAVLDERADHTEAIKEVLERLKFELEIAFDEPIFDTVIGKIIDSTIDRLIEELTHQPTKIEHNSLCETETYESR